MHSRSPTKRQQKSSCRYRETYRAKPKRVANLRGRRKAWKTAETPRTKMREKERKRETNEVKKSRQSPREIVGFVGPEVRLRLRARVERRDNWERLETISKFQRDEAYRSAIPLPFLGQSLSYRASSGNTRRLHGPSCSGNQRFATSRNAFTTCDASKYAKWKIRIIKEYMWLYPSVSWRDTNITVSFLEENMIKNKLEHLFSYWSINSLLNCLFFSI